MGFDGWDWAILVQSLLFSIMSLIIKLRKLRKDLLERMDQGTGVLGAGAPVMQPGVELSSIVAAT